jgi:hypothetical protein
LRLSVSMKDWAKLSGSLKGSWEKHFKVVVMCNVAGVLKLEDCSGFEKEGLGDHRQPNVASIQLSMRFQTACLE